MALFNRYTGERATPEQKARVIARANAILDSPYSSPERLAWAMDVIPPDQFEARFWESVRKGKERKRAQQEEENAAILSGQQRHNLQR